MAQTMKGTVVSTKMKGSVVVEVTRKTPHPLYRKLILQSKRYIVDSKGAEVKEGDVVTIIETRKMAGSKHFALKQHASSVKEGKK